MQHQQQIRINQDEKRIINDINFFHNVHIVLFDFYYTRNLSARKTYFYENYWDFSIKPYVAFWDKSRIIFPLYNTYSIDALKY